MEALGALDGYIGDDQARPQNDGLILETPSKVT